jgi:two-component system, LytTR family, sensor kinase
MPASADAGPQPVRIATTRVLAIAILLGLIGAGQHNMVMRAQYGDKGLGHALGMGMPYWLLWALFFPLVAAVAREFPIRREHWIGPAGIHLALALGVTVLHSFLEMAIHHVIGVQHGSFELFTSMSLGRAWWQLPHNLLAYGAILGVAVATESSFRARRERLAAAALGTELAEARLGALRAQLNPHFLFNAMNSISMLVRKNDNAAAITMIAGLSELMRSFLDERPPQQVTLREELAFLDRYLAVEQLRFQDRLQIRIDAEPAALEAMVPNLVLQPLVENAIKHGISRRAAAGRLDIKASCANGTMTLTVADDGPGLNGAGAGSEGIGLSNVRARLAHLYGSAQTFTLAQSSGGGAVATITLPCRVPPS